MHDDGTRNKEQHEGKGKEWAYNNHNMRNPSLHLFYGVTHVMIVVCPSLAFAFILLLISHAIITGFACIYCILFLYFLALSSLHHLRNILMKCFSHFIHVKTCIAIGQFRVYTMVHVHTYMYIHIKSSHC